MNKKMVMTEDLETITLKQVVKDTLRNYFANIGGEQPIDFYSILLEEIERPLLEVLINHTHYNQVRMAQMFLLNLAEEKTVQLEKNKRQLRKRQ